MNPQTRLISARLKRLKRTACLHSTAKRQAGLTLVELLVALAISSVIAIAAVASLIASRQGFSTVDAASQLRDNARFATDLIQRLGVQAGYQDVSYSASVRAGNTTGLSADPVPNITGVNNATVSASDPANDSTARSNTSSVGYGSDILRLRYQASETFPGSGLSDNSMIDCTGNPITAIPTDRDDRSVSILHVGISQDGEPSLMCSVQPNQPPQPIIRGVENFQVLYGVDGVVANTAPTGATGIDSIADRYMRADQLQVSGDPEGTNANWRRVRSLRIGMVLRGAVGSAQQPVAQTLYPLGQAKSSGNGAVGSALSSSNDPGTVFVAPADGRLRQVVTFTVHLRNEQGL